MQQIEIVFVHVQYLWDFPVISFRTPKKLCGKRYTLVAHTIFHFEYVQLRLKIGFGKISFLFIMRIIQWLGALMMLVPLIDYEDEQYNKCNIIKYNL